MRLTATEKYEIIQQVTRSELGVKLTLEEYGIARSTFYKWYQSYLEQGFDGLKPKQRLTNRQWNSIPDSLKDLVVKLALEYPELSSSLSKLKSALAPTFLLLLGNPNKRSISFKMSFMVSFIPTSVSCPFSYNLPL